MEINDINLFFCKDCHTIILVQKHPLFSWLFAFMKMLNSKKTSRQLNFLNENSMLAGLYRKQLGKIISTTNNKVENEISLEK